MTVIGVTSRARIPPPVPRDIPRARSCSKSPTSSSTRAPASPTRPSTSTGSTRRSAPIRPASPSRSRTPSSPPRPRSWCSGLTAVRDGQPQHGRQRSRECRQRPQLRRIVAAAEGALRRDPMHERELFIDGRWRPAREGRRATIADPGDGRACRIDRDRGRQGHRRCGRRRQTRPAGLGRDARRRARAHPASRRRPHRRTRSTPSRTCSLASRASRSRTRVKEIRFGVEVIRYYAEEGRRIGGSIRASVARGRAQPRRLLAGRRGRRDHALELSGRHLCVEGRAGAGGRLHAGRQAAAGDAARHRACSCNVSPTRACRRAC